MLSVAAVGECMIEFAPDGKGGWQMGFAGDTFNTLWTLRALLPGMPKSTISRLSAMMISRAVRWRSSVSMGSASRKAPACPVAVGPLCHLAQRCRAQLSPVGAAIQRHAIWPTIRTCLKKPRRPSSLSLSPALP